MDVEPGRPVEQAGRNERAVGDDDERVDAVERERLVEPLVLTNTDPEPLRRLLGRRRTELSPTTARSVWTREQERDLVSRGQPLEDVSSERRRRRDGQLHRGTAGGAAFRTSAFSAGVRLN